MHAKTKGWIAKTWDRATDFVRRHLILIVIFGGILSLLISLGAWFGVGYILQGQQNRDDLNSSRIACQKLINTDLLQALDSRSKPSRYAILAPRAFFNTLLPELRNLINSLEDPNGPPPDPADVRKSIEGLYAAAAAADEDYDTYIKALNKNPLPTDPDELCKEG